MKQCLNLTKCGSFYDIVSPVVHAFLPLVLQSLDSCGIEALALMLKEVLNSRYEMIIGLIVLHSQVFFHVRK